MNENNNPTNLNGNIPYPNQPDPNTMNNINNPSNISPSIFLLEVISIKLIIVLILLIVIKILV